MSLGLYANGPITVDLMLQTLYPQTDREKKPVSFLLSYDLLIKNRATEPISKLAMVHQCNLMPPPKASLKEDVPAWEKQGPEWRGKELYEEPPQEETGGLVRLRVALPSSDTGLPSTETVVAKLVNAKSVRIHAEVSAEDKRRSLFDETWPTVLEVELAEPMQPFASTKDTAYLLRLTFKSEVFRPIASQQLPVHPEKKVVMHKRSFEVLSPDLVWERLEQRLLNVRREAAAKKEAERQTAADALLQALVRNGFRAPTNTTRFREIQTALVSDQRTMLLDTHEVGTTVFWMIKDLSTMAGRHAHLWLSGSDHYPNEDPVRLAADLCNRYWDASSRKARRFTLEQAILDSGVDRPQNLSTVIDALVQTKALLRENDGSFRLADVSIERLAANAPDKHLAWEREVRQHIAGQILTDPAAFVPRPFRLVFSVASFSTKT